MEKPTIFALTILLLLTAAWFTQDTLLQMQILRMRVATYTILLLATAIAFGIRPQTPKLAGSSTQFALIFAATFGMIIILLIAVFGGVNNEHAPHRSIIMQNAFFMGVPILAQEFIRHKLLQNCARSNREAIAVLLVLAFTISRLPFPGPQIGWQEYVFGLVLFSLILNILLTTIAINGSLVAQLILGLLYGLFLVISPGLPNFTPMVLSLIISVIMYVNWQVYLIANSRTKPWHTARLKRIAKSQRKLPIMSLLTIGVLALVAAFMLGAFRFYPKAVLTDSMSGTFERGALVIIERIDHYTFHDHTVARGDVIHFVRDGMEITHRIVEYRFDAYGRKVFLTRGDANATIDSAYVRPENIRGVVRMIMPYIGMPSVMMRQVFGF